KSLDTHLRQVHDQLKGSSQIRVESLLCKLCSKEFKTASGLKRHVNGGHTNVKPGRRTSRITIPDVSHACDVCGQGFNSTDDFCTHMESHPIVLDVTEEIQTDISNLLSFVKDEVHCTIGSPALGNAILERFDAFVGYSLSGTKSAILTPVKSHKQVEAGFDSIIALPRCSAISNNSDGQSLGLRNVMNGYQYGQLVDVSIYKPVTAELFSMSFYDESSTIAKMLAGSLIQSNIGMTLILKVEIYSRLPAEDIHSLTIALPVSELYVIRVVEHDSCSKLVIGTHHWNALVTASIDLASGEPLVGPNQKNMLVSRASTLYFRDDFKQNWLTQRQVRSKFHDPTTYKLCSAVFWQFSFFGHRPVTFAHLLNFYIKKNYSGIKAVAEIFNSIFTQKEQNKYITKEFLDEVIRNLAVADSTKNRKRGEHEVDNFGSVFNCLTDIQKLFGKSQERLQIDKNIDKHLQVLASSAIVCIRRLNNSEISNNIKQQMKAILNERFTNKTD
ncbi:hypothetical protein BGZ49_002642, partial [Haplosporangium sp. Z 27]